jgi:hypothetical protein
MNAETLTRAQAHDLVDSAEQLGKLCLLAALRDAASAASVLS